MSANSVLPHILAVINASTIITLATGYHFIREGNREAHRKCMTLAIVLGSAFLFFYLVYHFGAGLAKFGGEGVIRPIYFGILIIHILAAAVSTPLVPLVVWRALTNRLSGHRQLAPFAFGIWMFVAVSGLVVYVMTIHIWPYSGVAA
jgi:putative membrane protein